ncbi:hypothetical protein EP7_003943 [Isosphaeraceae bacterium EP7]
MADMVPDYYAMLGVAPNADRSEIEAALSRQQPLWSSGTRNPKTKHAFQSYLDQIPAIRHALLGDPSNRASYDLQIAAVRQAERTRKLDVLQKLVVVRAAKGGLTVSDRALLRDRAASLGLNAEDLDKLAEPFPLKAEPPPEIDTPEAPVDALDPATRRQIRVGLTHLGLRHLYDALGVPRDAAGDAIVARAEEERGRWMRKSQVTAEKTAWLEVISYAQSHLGSPAARSRYDRTLAVEAEEELSELIAFALEGNERLDPGTRQILVDEASARGIAPVRADRLILRVCKTLGVARDAPSLLLEPPTATRWLRCRSCGGLNDHTLFIRRPDQQAPCRHCAIELRWSCPVCQRSRWPDEPRCSCGFPLERREILVQTFEAAQQAFKVRDDDSALESLRRVQELAPGHVGARKGIEKIKHRRADLAKVALAWKTTRAARQFVAAREVVSQWAKLVDPETAELQAAWAELTKALHEAGTLTARARRLESSEPNAARALYRQALTLVSDLAEARDGLLRSPPDPPTGLTIESDGDLLRLRWKPPADDGLGPPRFRVMRMRAGSTNFSAPAELVAETDATFCDDPGATPGDSVAYSVHSVRDGVRSLTSAQTGPLLVLGEPGNFISEGRDGEIVLTWSLPAKALGARLIRKTGAAPNGPEDGLVVDSLRESARDAGLSNDQVYHYAVFAEYRGQAGAVVLSRATSLAASPHPPIGGLDAPKLAREPDGRVRIDWHQPERGSVRIVRSEKPLNFEAGERLVPEQLKTLSADWLEDRGGNATFDSSPPAAGVCYYTPLTSWAGTWTVGASAPYSCVPDPTDLRAVRVGGAGRVHLRWRWSPRVSQCLVVSKPGSAPDGPDDREATVLQVSEGEYSRQGYQTLTLPTAIAGPWHLAVFSLMSSDGERLVSPGLEPTARTIVPGPNPEVTVSYTLRKGGFPGRPWSLLFRTDPAGSTIPPTAIVAHPRTIPLSVDDGEIVARLPATRDGASFPIPTTIDLARHLARVFPDPAADPESQAPIRLRHPDAGQTRA